MIVRWWNTPDYRPRLVVAVLGYGTNRNRERTARVVLNDGAVHTLRLSSLKVSKK